MIHFRPFVASCAFIITILSGMPMQDAAFSQNSSAPAEKDSGLVTLFRQTPEEQLTPTRWEIGNTIISNEDRLEFFKKHIEDIGGGYAGLGGTQNFLLASWANSEWIWLFDFTQRVVTANRIHIAFLKSAATPQEFRSLWTKKSNKKVMKIIDEEFAGDPDMAYIKKTWNIGLGFVPWRFRTLERVTKKYNYKIWLNDQGYYDRLRSLALNDRIIARKGSLNGSVTIEGIAETSKKMGVPIRVVYLSNAEEYIKNYTDQFKKNFIAIPGDEKSVILRTTSVYRRLFPWAPDSELSTDKGFHYNITPLRIFQEWMSLDRQKLRVIDIMKTGEVNMKDGVSVIKVSPPKEGEKKNQK